MKKECRVCGIQFETPIESKKYCSIDCKLFLEDVTARLDRHIKKRWTETAPKPTVKKTLDILQFNNTTYNEMPVRIYQVNSIT